MFLTLVLAVSPALAWKHAGYVWYPEDLPREYYLDDDVEDSLPEGYPDEVIETGFDAWEVPEAACANLSHEYMGKGEFTHSSSDPDGVTAIFWDDPSNELAPGVLGLTFLVPDGSRTTIGGTQYYHFLEADIAFNNDVDWGVEEDIEAGRCSGEYSIEGVATHEIGHSWGMGHSCEQGESCPDPVKFDATMYWSGGACSTKQSDINSDDVEGVSALYGPYGSFTATTARYGAAPLAVGFEATSEDTIVGVQWTFGDGETSTENPVTHTYASSGQFSVQVAITVTSEDCGGESVTYTASELGYVLSCDPPRPEDGATGFFEIQPIEGLTYQTINHSDVSVYGCVDTIAWEVYKGSSAADITPANIVDFNGTDENGGTQVGAWAPKITFPEAGSYVVVMNVGGPGGLDANYLVVDVSDASAGGCAAVPGTAAGAGALLLVGALVTRRRRTA